MRKLIALAALTIVMTVGLAPIEAQATTPSGPVPGNHSCSISGNFTITYENGQIVASDLDRDCSGTAAIPEGVTFIGHFQYGASLVAIEIPSSVTEIQSYAFSQCTSLTTFSIAPNSSLTSIPEELFGNTRLTSFHVPASVTSIGNTAFANLSTLTSLTFEANSQLETIQVGAFRRTGLNSVTLPRSLVTLRNEAFLGSTSLASVTFESGSRLTTIGDEVFSGLPQSTIALPDTVSTLGRGLFAASLRITISETNPNFLMENNVIFNKNKSTLVAYAPWLTDATYVIPASVSAIGPFAFEDSQLQTLNIPATVMTLGRYAFSRSRQLSNVTFSQNSAITTIPLAAFQASGLEQITIPASVSVLEGYAFNTSRLAQITFAPNSSLQEISTNAFSSASLTSIEVPAGVHTIGSEAFRFNAQLTDFRFANGSNLREMGAYALGNTSVTALALPATPSRTGYTFLGWSNTSNGSVIDNAATSVLASQAIYAIWQPLPVLTFNSNSGSPVPNRTLGQGEAVVAPTPPTRTGFNFAGWSLVDGGEAITFPFLPSSYADFTLYALWTAAPTIAPGSEPDSQVVTIPVGLTAAAIPASANLPRVSLAFAATNTSASATIVPIANPAVAAATPFAVTSSTKIVDIQVSGISGPVTVCLDGASTDEVFHYTGGAWVALPQRTFTNGQVCGLTDSFSPFAAAEPAPVVQNAPYTGPTISGRLNKLVATVGGSEFSILGDRLSQVTSVNLDGKALTIVSKTDSKIVVQVPAHSAGRVSLVLKSDLNSVTYQDAFEYVEPKVVRTPVLTTKTVVISSASAKSLTAGQRNAVKAFVGSATAGAVLTCSATYTTKTDAKNAKALAAAACESAKKAKAGLVTRVAAPVLVNAKTARKVLLSLRN